jgi:hypothetical protein
LEERAETDRMQGNYQEIAARSLQSFEEPEERLRQLDETRATAERDLATLEGAGNN